MRPFLWTFIVLFLSAAHVITGHAQVDKLKKGDHVRIIAPSISIEQITGDVNEVTDRGIILTGSPSEISFNDIEKLEVGKKSSRILQGTLIGGATGGLLLGTISMATNEPCSDDEWCFFEFSDGEAFLLGAAVGALPGLLIGGIVGSTIEGYNWKTIQIEMSEPPVAFQHLINSSSRLPVLKLRIAF